MGLRFRDGLVQLWWKIAGWYTIIGATCGLLAIVGVIWLILQ